MLDKILKSKWIKLWFALSAAAFVGLEITFGSKIGMLLNVPLAFILVLLLERKYSVLNWLFQYKQKLYVFISLPVAAWFIAETSLQQKRYIERAFASDNPLAVKVRETLPEALLWLGYNYFTAVAAIASAFFVFSLAYAVVSRFKSVIVCQLKELWFKTDKIERYYLAAGFLVITCVLSIVYSLTDVFYSEKIFADRLYGTDTSAIMQADALFYFPERSGIKRLMFCLFNLPIALISKLVSRILFFIPFIYPLALQILTAWLLLLTGVIIARMANAKGLPKLLILLIWSFSFSSLFYMLTVEMYILPTFCAVLAAYLCSANSRFSNIGIVAAASTLTTSIAFIPLGTYTSDVKQWFVRLTKVTLMMLLLIILCGKLAIVLGAADGLRTNLVSLKPNDFQGNLLQFFSFISSVFLFPPTILQDTEILPNSFYEFILANYGEQSNALIRIAMPTSINIIGAIFLTLAFVSIIINRKSKSALLAMAWIAVSAIVLLFLGWQSGENFLCSTYFGWAYFLLVVMLIEKLFSRYVIIRSVIYSLALIFVLAANIPGILYVINFGITNYPA